jgi:hypothetical protein
VDIEPFVQFCNLARESKRIQDSGASWEFIHHVIFSHLRPKVKQTGINFNWYDPDTTYEEEVLSYVQALTEKAEEVQKIIDAVKGE